MTRLPSISVIMPLYNKRPYVRRAIESVRQQTMDEWELIIIDDGSTDGSTSEIPADDKRIRLLQQKNAGPGAARNYGIREARGEIITFLDADDVYYPHKLKEEMILLQNRKTRWMISAFDREKDNEVMPRGIYDIRGNELKSPVLLVDNALFRLSMSGIHIDGLCIHRHVLLDVGGFNEGMRCFEITELMIRCALEQPEVLVCSKPLFRVVDVPDSAFKVSSHRIDSMRQMAESLYNLSLRYPEFSKVLSDKGKGHLLSYARSQIFLDKKNEARKCLIHKYPYPRDKKWMKLWILSWVPNRLLDLIFEKNLNN